MSDKSKNIYKIAITGGPCGGKTGISSYIRKELKKNGYRVLWFPEVARGYIENGIFPDGDKLTGKKFEEFIIKKQIAVEEIYEEAAEVFASDDEKVVIFYDRGLPDVCAYIERSVYEEILSKYDLTLESALRRYDAVIHLVTAADGAVENYQWAGNEDESKRDPDRHESPEEAIILDKKLEDAWKQHPSYLRLDNSTTYLGKKKKAREKIYKVLGIDKPKDYQLKLLIKRPTEEIISGIEGAVHISIEQTYLLRKNSEPEKERRVRLWKGDNEKGLYLYTKKEDSSPDITDAERNEWDKVITEEEYNNYLEEADSDLSTIKKDRWCFKYKNYAYELDIIPVLNDDEALIEVKLDSLEDAEIEDIKLDMASLGLEVIKDVTTDADYRNINIARR